MPVPLPLLEALPQVPDPRNPKGVRHPLAAVLSLAVLAMLTGAKSYSAIAQFGRQRGAALALALGFRRGKTLSKSALADLFRRLDAVAFEAALSRWVASRMGPSYGLHICIDGKTVRGSRDGAVPGHHLVAAYVPAAQAVLAQLRVDSKTNEHKAALELFGVLPVRGNIFTADALLCQRDLCAKVIEGGGDYILTVKDNQPALAADIRAGLAFKAEKRRQAAASPYEEAPPAAGSVARRVDKGHGRVEVRTLRLTSTLTKTQQWAGLRQGFELTRERTEKGEKTVEVVYGITSLSRRRADATKVLGLTREHWGIENSCHWTLDVIYRGDESRIRDEQLRENFAWLNRLTLSLLKQHPGKGSIAMKRRSCGWDDKFLLEVLTGTTT